MNNRPYSMSPGPYQFYTYYSFACAPGMVDQFSRQEVAKDGAVRFRVPLRNGQIFVVIEFKDGIETVSNPNDTYEYMLGCVPELFDTMVNPDARVGGRVTSVVPYTGDQILYKMDRLRLPQYSRKR